jgi:hypothetical protein
VSSAQRCGVFFSKKKALNYVEAEQIQSKKDRKKISEFYRLAGSKGDWCDIDRGVRQGCVIAPLLFNTFFDCVVRLAVSRMPEGCGVQLAYRIIPGTKYQKSDQ